MVALTVRLCSFPESNGKRNWTAMFVRTEPWGGLVGNCGGITIARGELWNRVAYEAECARALIGERDTEPHILDYGDDIHTPDEWVGEVRGGRQVRAAEPKVAADEAREPLTDYELTLMAQRASAKPEELRPWWMVLCREVEARTRSECALDKLTAESQRLGLPDAPQPEGGQS
jgi:hypothetical protein